MITIQNYVRAKSLEEAWELNQKRRNHIIGGMLWLKMGRGSISTAIDLCNLGLDTITETDEEFSIGCMVTLRQIEQHEGLNRYSCGACREAVKDIVGVQFRNIATIGGSIWGRFGFSDVLTVLLSMDTYVELYEGGIVPLAKFARKKRDNDVLVRIIIRKTPGKFVYSAVRTQSTDFPALTCAVSLMDGEYRAVFGARPAKAMVIKDEKGFLKEGISEASVSEFAKFCSSEVPTEKNIRGTAAYRSHLVRVLCKRNLMKLGGML